MAIEIMNFPRKHGSFHSYVIVYQRVLQEPLKNELCKKNPLFVDDVDDWFGVIRLYYPILGMIIIYEMGHPFLSSQYLSGRDSPGDWWLIMMATPIREIHEISTIGLLVFYFYDPTIYSSKEKLSSVSHF